MRTQIESSFQSLIFPGDDGSNSTTPHWARPADLPLVPIILTIVGVLIILLLLTDLIFYKTRETGEECPAVKLRSVWNTLTLFGRNHISGVQDHATV